MPVAAPNPQAEASIARQNTQILNLVKQMDTTEVSRQTRLYHSKNPKELKSLEKRFVSERKVDRDRLNILLVDTARIKKLASVGAYNGTQRVARSQPQTNFEEVPVTGLQARGGLTDSQYKFMKQQFDKFEAPVPVKKMTKNRAPDISFFRDQKAARRRDEVNSARRGLLGEKRQLLNQLATVVTQQEALINNNNWGSSSGRSSSMTSARSSYSSYSSHSNVSSASTAFSMASMARRPEHTFTRKESMSRPNKVPVLF